MNTLKIDGNSTINQKIKGKLVEREVICNLNHVIQHIQEHGAGVWEDELNDLLYSYDYDQTIENLVDEDVINIYEREEYGYSIRWKYPDDSSDDYSEPFESRADLVNELQHHIDFDMEINEVYEFWGVSDFLARKLRENGEAVVEMLGFNVWGRCTTGQAILLDVVITEIAHGMEILDGQNYSWSGHA